eukprot:3668481-Prymnesium_polylepis.1
MPAALAHWPFSPHLSGDGVSLYPRVHCLPAPARRGDCRPRAWLFPVVASTPGLQRGTRNPTC